MARLRRSLWDLGRGGFVVCRHVPAAEARELEEGVDGGFERPGVALNLGEDEAALECGEEGDGEVVRVGAVREVPGLRAAPRRRCAGMKLRG